MVKNDKKKAKTIQAKQDIFVSLVVITNEDLRALDEAVKRAWAALDSSYTNYEILVVSNGFTGNELTELVDLLYVLPCIRIIRLSYKTSYDTALFAGLEAAIGDYVVTFNPSLDSPEGIKGIIEANKQADIVQGVSDVPVTGLLGSQMGRRLFYWYNRKYVGVDIPMNATYFAAYSRRAVNSLTSTKRSVRHIRHIARLVGYQIVNYRYTPLESPAKQRSLRTGIIEALEIVTGYSTHPLRFVTWLGVIASLINVLYAFYVVLLNISGVQVAEGWTTTSLQLSGMFFFLFLILVLFSEYLGRILTESRKDPSYYIADELTSTVSIADVNRRNITE